jgi:LysR family glycine cleavage system transcriptional activator
MMLLHRIPPASLRAFQQVAEHLSFTRAAQAMHVTQSAVSQQVAQLEQRLGKRLVERSARSVRLTEHGEALAAACQRSFAVLESALQRIAGNSDANSLNFKVPPTFAMKWLMPRLPRFQVRHAQVELRVNTSLQPADFEAENVDISMQRAVEPEPGCHAIAVLEERGLLVCSPKLWRARPARLSELDGMTLLESANRRDDWSSWLAQAGAAKIRIANRLEFGFSLLVYQAAVEGLGVAIAQPEFVQDELASGKLMAPFRKVFATGKRYFLVCPVARRHSPAVARFLSWVQSELASSK